MNEINVIPKGWECPKCGAVMAPHVDVCVNCRGNSNGSATTLNGFFMEHAVNTLCMTEADHEWESTGISTAGIDYHCRKCYAYKCIPFVTESN
jgi:hypothetical protein